MLRKLVSLIIVIGSLVLYCEGGDDDGNGVSEMMDLERLYHGHGK